MKKRTDERFTIIPASPPLRAITAFLNGDGQVFYEEDVVIAWRIGSFINENGESLLYDPEPIYAAGEKSRLHNCIGCGVVFPGGALWSYDISWDDEAAFKQWVLSDGLAYLRERRQATQ